MQTDLIAALATPPGQGGIGVIRLSGPHALDVAKKVCGRRLKVRYATYCEFSDGDEVLDQGLVLYFEGPASFTGEEVVEFQGHGGPVVLQRLLDLVCRLGARLARPGEFSERAFLNGKLDLAQAEAVADLIASSSVAAAKAAMKSLQGRFSNEINELTEKLAKLRILVEACIDFPDEDVEFLQTGQVSQRIEALHAELAGVLKKGQQGRLLNDGISVALLGAPNAGKSSLLNMLSGEQAAIVTDIPGTTRDLLKVDLVLDGLPIQLVDTAGIRDSDDVVEKIGVDKAKTQAKEADLALLILDAQKLANGDPLTALRSLRGDLPETVDEIIVLNKVDLLSDQAVANLPSECLPVSALTGQGLDKLQQEVRRRVGLEQTEASFIARTRHVDALQIALTSLSLAGELIGAAETTPEELSSEINTEIVAEELRNAHNALGEIVGTVTPDDLLGRIFSEFCIGK